MQRHAASIVCLMDLYMILPLGNDERRLGQLAGDPKTAASELLAVLAVAQTRPRFGLWIVELNVVANCSTVTASW
jgi:hypothetical protein